MADNGTGVAAVLDAVRSTVPRLRENGLEAESDRWLPEENIELLDKAGVFRMATPRRFGGLELSLEDQSTVLAEIARGCPASSWVAMVWVSSAWMVSLYPEPLQQEVFSGPSARISGGFSPTGTLTPTEAATSSTAGGASTPVARAPTGT